MIELVKFKVVVFTKADMKFSSRYLRSEPRTVFSEVIVDEMVKEWF